MIKFKVYIVMLISSLALVACDGVPMPTQRSKNLDNYDKQVREFFKNNNIVLAEEFHTSTSSNLFYDIKGKYLKDNELVKIKKVINKSGWMLKKRNDISELYCDNKNQIIEITRPYNGTDKKSFIGGPFPDKWIITLATQIYGFDECKE